jgi:hypothetical protein
MALLLANTTGCLPECCGRRLLGLAMVTEEQFGASDNVVIAVAAIELWSDNNIAKLIGII